MFLGSGPFHFMRGCQMSQQYSWKPSLHSCFLQSSGGKLGSIVAAEGFSPEGEMQVIACGLSSPGKVSAEDGVTG